MQPRRRRLPDGAHAHQSHGAVGQVGDALAHEAHLYFHLPALSHGRVACGHAAQKTQHEQDRLLGDGA